MFIDLKIPKQLVFPQKPHELVTREPCYGTAFCMLAHWICLFELVFHGSKISVADQWHQVEVHSFKHISLLMGQL